jgi:hypothetical protein
LPKAEPDGAFAVDYRAGQLSVMADKAELGKVLRMVGTKTGASIEVAPEIAAEPIVAHLGPGLPNQVLSELLDSPHLEYIVMGSDEDAQGWQRIVVRKRASFGRQQLTMMNAPPAPSFTRNEMNKAAEPVDQEGQVTAPAAQQQAPPSAQPDPQQDNPPRQ